MTRALLLAALCTACAADTGDAPDADYPCRSGTICPSYENQYVADSHSLTAAATLDIDGDGAAENLVGAELARLDDPRIDAPGAVQRGVRRGETITLFDLRAVSLTTAPDAVLHVLLGKEPTPAPCTSDDERTCGQHLDGNGSFNLAVDSPLDALLPGAIIGGRLAAGPGVVELRLWLGAGDPIPVRLVGARVAATVSDTMLSGTLGGGIHEPDLRDRFLPAVSAYVDAAVARDCPAATPPCCTPDTAGEGLIAALDLDGNCSLDTTELPGLGGPDLLDLDLLDADGTFAPNTDSVRDSASFSIDFTAVPAAFPTPP